MKKNKSLIISTLIGEIMFGLSDDSFKKNETLLKELLLRHQSEESHFEELFEQYKISDEDLSIFLSNPEHFDSESWKAMQYLREELQHQLSRRLSMVKDPLKAKKKYNDLRRSQHWIPVK